MTYDEADKLAMKLEKKAIKEFDIDDDVYRTASLCGFWRSIAKSMFRGEKLEDVIKLYKVK